MIVIDLSFSQRKNQHTMNLFAVVAVVMVGTATAWMFGTPTSYLNSDYQFTTNRLVKTPYLDKLPLEQLPSPVWSATLAANAAGDVLTNALKNALAGSLNPADWDIVIVLNAIVGNVSTANPARASSVLDYIKNLQDNANAVPSVGDVDTTFNITISNKAFAEYRLSGPNPTSIKLAKTADLTNLGLGQNTTLVNLLNQKMLFVVDYSSLATFSLNTAYIPGVPKYVYGSIALFQQVGNNVLVPVCIKIISSGGQSKMFYPDGLQGPQGDYKWEMAKSLFQTNDGDYHEGLVHLGGTHLVNEIFMVATNRRFPRDHVLYKLLAPHFEGTAFINDAADKSLIADRGGVDVLVSVNIQELRGVIKTYTQSVVNSDMRFPQRIAARQMDTTNVPTLNYAYRDDGMLHWNAIYKWVTSYINLFYASDSAVAADDAIRQWILDLTSPTGGNVGWLANFQYTKKWLADVIASVIFIGSVDHAAVNFPQRPIMQFTPAFPLGAYNGPATSFKDNPTHEDYMSLLPPISIGLVQSHIGKMLGSLHYTKLGFYNQQYPLNIFGYFFGMNAPFGYLQGVETAMAQFQTDLSAITTEINRRNLFRTPYTTMLPDDIPQSINI